jgi:hypothetical protein
MAKFISLSKGMRAIVDDSDYEELSKHFWYLHQTNSTAYAARYEYGGGKRKLIYMHRKILPTIMHVDHINRNTLDNRRCNLRKVTVSENNLNRVFK